VLAYFGADVDRGEGAVGVDVDGVVGVGAKGSDEIGGCVGVEGLDPGDVIEELAVDKLLGREPNMMTLLVVYCVLMRVSVGSEARRGGEEVLERADVDCRVKYWDRGKNGRRRGGGGNGGNGIGSDGGGNILEGDVLERYVVDDVTCELKVAPTILGERGKEGVELFLGEADDVSGGVLSKLFKLELSSGAKSFEGGCGSRRGWGADDVWVRINGSGLEGVGVDEGDAGAGRRCGILGGLGAIDVVGAGAGGSEKGEVGDDELKRECGTGGNGGRPGDDGRRGAGHGGVLETGTSGTWVIPSVVGTVEDVVDDLKGGGGVLLVDRVQVGPRGDGDGRGGHFQTVSFN